MGVQHCNLYSSEEMPGRSVGPGGLCWEIGRDAHSVAVLPCSYGEGLLTAVTTAPAVHHTYTHTHTRFIYECEEALSAFNVDM